MGLRIGLVLALMGCAPEEEEEREVSQAAYPSEYAEALCRIQMQCSDADISMTECQELAESSVRGKLERNCFNESAAVDCLDTLDDLTCSGYESDEWSICGDVDDCSEL